MKEYECVQVNHHKNVGKTVQEWQEKGWRLHSYAVAGSPSAVNHYLLFEKGELKPFFFPLTNFSLSSLLAR